MSAQQPISNAKPPLTPLEKKRRADLYARYTYAAVMIVFVGIATIAVLSSMAMEKNREGYRPIEVSKPISFIDYTYVNDNKTPEPPAPELPKE